MDLQQELQKVVQDVEHAKLAVTDGRYELALASAKRGRRKLTLAVRQIAEQRDNATRQEATSNE